MHYASSDLSKSPIKICCISIQSFVSKQATTFSLVNYSSEKDLLKDFLKFAIQNQGKSYITWNMKDSTFGIQVIQKRINQLVGDKKIPIDDNEIFDMDEILQKKYGLNYVSHPKLKNLAKLNDMTMLGFINGARESELFERSDYRSIEQSTNRKVRIISNLTELLFENKLKVENRTPLSYFKEFIYNPIIQVLLGIISILLAILGIMISLG